MRRDLRSALVPVFQTMIRRTSGFPKAALAGVSIRDIDDVRARTAWNDYLALGTEIMEILQ